VIFVDTTPLVALCNPRDGHHRRALADINRLAPRGLLLCEPVLTEACFLLDRRVLRARLERIIAELSVRAWVPADPEAFRREVFAWLARYADQQPDWADGCLAAASDREKKARVWTYDSEFKTTWRRPSGGRIPLAIR
jgi:predicted nucleic acid-binding protein